MKNEFKPEMQENFNVEDVLSFITSLAYCVHNEQKYGDKPYTYHLRDVESTFLRSLDLQSIMAVRDSMGYSDVYTVSEMVSFLRAACIGHDMIEDTWVTAEFLRSKRIPEILIEIIEAVTKIKGETLMVYLEKVLSNSFAVLVKSADSQSNLQHSIMSRRVRGVNKYTTILRYLHGDRDENGHELNK